MRATWTKKKTHQKTEKSNKTYNTNAKNNSIRKLLLCLSDTSLQKLPPHSQILLLSSSISSSLVATLPDQLGELRASPCPHGLWLGLLTKDRTASNQRKAHVGWSHSLSPPWVPFTLLAPSWAREIQDHCPGHLHAHPFFRKSKETSGVQLLMPLSCKVLPYY